MYDSECEGEASMNYSVDRDMIWKRIEEADSYYIYGAQVVAYGVYTAVRNLSYKEPEAFIVSSRGNNPEKIEHIPVIEIYEGIDSGALIIVATPQIYHEDIKAKLDQFRLKNTLYVDTHVEYLIMSNYFKKLGRFLLLEDLPLPNEAVDDLSQVKIYMAKHHKDPILREKYELPPWIEPIQVGTTLTDQRIAGRLDNTGDNISHKNYKYSELTAMYWAWKNCREEYLGICHYRRILLLEQVDFRRIKEHGINVVLPLPFICYPDASGQYGRYISSDDQERMMQALREVSPEYYRGALNILKEPYLYNYNMFLADSHTFNDYCEWIFPILERAEALCEPDGRERRDRYIGYFAEVLTAIYFLYNKNNLRIAHGEKKWMV